MSLYLRTFIEIKFFYRTFAALTKYIDEVFRISRSLDCLILN